MLRLNADRIVIALSLVAVLNACSHPKPRSAGAERVPPKRHNPEPEIRDPEFDTFMRSDAAPNNICKFSSPQCGTERWGVKIGIDGAASSVHPAASSPSIQDLRNEASPGTVALCTPRYPQEKEVIELHDVRLVCFKWENSDKGDQDFHLVVEDPNDPVVAPTDDPTCKLLNPRNGDISKYNTIIVEIPDPDCLDADNPWHDPIAAARSAFLHDFSPQSGGQRVNEIVSLRGVRFFDVVHGQLGVVESNAIELHPVMGVLPRTGLSVAAAIAVGHQTHSRGLHLRVAPFSRVSVAT